MGAPSFSSVDIGSPRLPGALTPSDARFEILAGGEDIWGTRDECHFACVPVSGDFDLTARLDALGMADVYTKAGLMVRASLDEGAEHAYLLAFGDNQPRNNNNGGLEFQYRDTVNGPSIGVYPPQPLPDVPDFPVAFPDVWLRLVRRGNTFTASASRDGQAWKTFCVHQQSLPLAAHLGLAVTSHNPARPVTAAFSHVDLA
jgi:hypothetical protein